MHPPPPSTNPDSSRPKTDELPPEIPFWTSTFPERLRWMGYGAAIAALCVVVFLFELWKYTLALLGLIAAVAFVVIVWGTYRIRRLTHRTKQYWQHHKADVKVSTRYLFRLLLLMVVLPQGQRQRLLHSKQAETQAALAAFQEPLGLLRQLVLGFVLRFFAVQSLLALTTLVVSIAVFVTAYMQVDRLDVQNDKIERQTQLLARQDSLIEEQIKLTKQAMQLQEADRRASLVFLFSNIMDAIDEELVRRTDSGEARYLSPQLIGRIVALSQRLRPYRYLDGDTLIGKPLSPERGQLLLSLVYSDLDVETYRTIFRKANFRHSDLRGVRLETEGKQIELAGVDLAEANLDRSYFVNVNLAGVNLKGASCKKARWYDVNLYKALLIETNADSLEVMRCDFSEALISGEWQGVFFHKTILDHSIWLEANLRKAEFDSVLFANGVVFIDVNFMNFTTFDSNATTLYKALMDRVKCDSTIKGIHFNRALFRELEMETIPQKPYSIFIDTTLVLDTPTLKQLHRPEIKRLPKIAMKQIRPQLNRIKELLTYYETSFSIDIYSIQPYLRKIRQTTNRVRDHTIDQKTFFFINDKGTHPYKEK